MFIGNCLLTIEISCHKNSEGYACIEQISKFPEEKEVLINAKNVFKVK